MTWSNFALRLSDTMGSPVFGFALGSRKPNTARSCLPVNLSQYHVNASNTGYDVGDEPPLDELGKGLQVSEGRRSFVAAEGPRRTVADDVESKLSPRRLDGLINFADRRVKSFRHDLEVVYQRLNRSLHALTLRHDDMRSIGFDRPFGKPVN